MNNLFLKLYLCYYSGSFEVKWDQRGPCWCLASVEGFLAALPVMEGDWKSKRMQKMKQQGLDLSPQDKLPLSCASIYS